CPTFSRRSSRRPLMEQLLQHLVNGLVLGGTYALLGIGLTLIFGLMNVVNFAHGEFYTLGAYAAFAALGLPGLDFTLALLGAIAARPLGLARSSRFRLLQSARPRLLAARRPCRPLAGCWVRSSSPTRRWGSWRR